MLSDILQARTPAEILNTAVPANLHSQNAFLTVDIETEGSFQIKSFAVLMYIDIFYLLDKTALRRLIP